MTYTTNSTLFPRYRLIVAPRATIITGSAASRPAPLEVTSHSSSTFSSSYVYVYRRCFSQTTTLEAKKKGKKAAARDEEEDDEDDEDQPQSRKNARGKNNKNSNANPSEDFDHEAAFDLADVETEYTRIDERFEKRLQEFKASGGRFNPDLLGQLKVRPDRESAQVYPLRELAQVVHRGGRSVSIMVSDQSYIKPIMSAVQASAEFNQQPQRDPDNDLELVLRIEPENPDEQAKRMRAEINAWKDAVREVLSTRKNKHATWLKAKHVTKDDVKKLDKAVKALQDKKLETIEKKEKQLTVELANRQKRL